MNESFDVIVVGAGPAGLSASFYLGKKGFNVLLIEKKAKELIGEKTCGDALSSYSTRRLKEEIQFEEPKGESICEKLTTAVLYSENKFEISIPFSTQTIDRLKYGQQLIKKISEFSSVTLLTDTKVISPIIAENKITGVVTLNNNGEKRAYKGKIIVDCSGYTGIVRKQLPSSMYHRIHQVKKSETIVSCREIIETENEHPFQKQMRIELHPELPPPGYFWIFSKGRKQLNIGVGWLITEKNKNIKPSDVLSKIRKKIFPNCKILQHNTDLLPGRLPLYSMVGENFIACGDAAALVNPINGEGHGPALLSGYYSAKVIEEAFERDDFSENSLWKYNVKIWEEFGYSGSMGIAIHKLLKKYPISSFEYLFTEGIVTQKDIDNILGDLGYKPPIFEKIVKGLKKPKLTLRIIRMILIAKKIERLARSYPTDTKKFDKWKKRIVKLENKDL